jgi:TonB-dependent SusC/RagA subfamily outer membrane receptor
VKNKLLVLSGVCLIVGSIAIKTIAKSIAPPDFSYNTTLIISPGSINKVMSSKGPGSNFEQIFPNLDPVAQHIRLDIASVRIQSGNLPLAMFKSIKIYLSQDNGSTEALIASNINISKNTKSSLVLNLYQILSQDRSIKTSRIDQYSSIEQAILGSVSGVELTDKGLLRVRGINNLVDGSPLFIVDGSEMSNIKTLNPNDIESVVLLKNYSETALYGVRGANGVFLIKTKTGNSALEKTSNVLNPIVKGSIMRVRLEYVLRNPIRSETALQININLEPHQN